MFPKIDDDLFCYDLWISADGVPYVTHKTRAQFLFAVSGLPNSSSPEKLRTLRFRVMNMSAQSKLIGTYGHKPVAVILDEAAFNDVKAQTVSLQA